jgi:hypothetical protein
MVVTAPPHSSGRVDITVRDEQGITRTARNAFLYASATAPETESEYERVMFPLHFAGAGAHGSRWNTIIELRNQGHVPAHTMPALDPASEALPPLQRALFPTESSDGGRFLYVRRGLERFLTFSSHIVDESRTEAQRGTEIPVVRASDTASEVRLLGVRVGEGYRARLRIYDFDARPGRDLLVIITSPGWASAVWLFPTLSPGIVCVAAPCFQPGPTYATIDLTAIPELRNVRSFDVTVMARQGDARIWAFASVTNNATQHVTLWTPQPPPFSRDRFGSQ